MPRPRWPDSTNPVSDIPGVVQVEYDETIWASRDTHRNKRLEAKLHRQAKRLGYQLVPIPELPAA